MTARRRAFLVRPYFLPPKKRLIRVIFPTLWSFVFRVADFLDRIGFFGCGRVKIGAEQAKNK